MSSVDIIIPSYNYASFLPDCVTSILAQRGVELRVLIIDDASQDDTPAVGARMAKLDSRVEFRRHEQNQGHISTFNEGLEWATADYTVLLSADDMLMEGALKRAADLMDAHPEAGLVYGKELRFQTANCLPKPPASDQVTWQIMTGRQFLEVACTAAGNVVSTPGALVRTSIQKQIGGYRHELPHSGDLEMWLRFGAHAAVGVLDSYQAYYRIHGSNMSLGYLGIKDYRQLKAAFETLFDSYRDRISNVGQLRDFVHRNLTERIYWSADSACEIGKWDESRELYDFAVELVPELESEKKWRFLRLKHKIKAVWPALRYIREKIR